MRLPDPPSYYSQSDQSALRAQLRDADALNAKNNADARFNNLVVSSLAVIGAMTIGGDLTVTGSISAGNDLTFGADGSGNLNVPAPTFNINGNSTNATAFKSVAGTASPSLAAWLAPPGGGVPTWNSITFAYLPDWTEIAQPDAVVTTVANTAVANQALSSVLNVAANSLSVGDCIRFTARGVYGDTTVAPTINLLMRASTSGTLCSTGANAVGAVSLTNKGWEVVVDFVVTALGSLTGRLEVQGRARLSTGATTSQDIDMANIAVVTYNTTVAQTLQLCVTWGTANAANTITCRQTIWEVLKQ